MLIQPGVSQLYLLMLVLPGVSQLYLLMLVLPGVSQLYLLNASSARRFTIVLIIFLSLRVPNYDELSVANTAASETCRPCLLP